MMHVAIVETELEVAISGEGLCVDLLTGSTTIMQPECDVFDLHPSSDHAETPDTLHNVPMEGSAVAIEDAASSTPRSASLRVDASSMQAEKPDTRTDATIDIETEAHSFDMPCLASNNTSRCALRTGRSTWFHSGGRLA